MISLPTNSIYLGLFGSDLKAVHASPPDSRFSCFVRTTAHYRNHLESANSLQISFLFMGEGGEEDGQEKFIRTSYVRFATISTNTCASGHMRRKSKELKKQLPLNITKRNRLKQGLSFLLSQHSFEAPPSLQMVPGATMWF